VSHPLWRGRGDGRADRSANRFTWRPLPARQPHGDVVAGARSRQAQRRLRPRRPAVAADRPRLLPFRSRPRPKGATPAARPASISTSRRPCRAARRHTTMRQPGSLGREALLRLRPVRLDSPSTASPRRPPPPKAAPSSGNLTRRPEFDSSGELWRRRSCRHQARARQGVPGDRRQGWREIPRSRQGRLFLPARRGEEADRLALPGSAGRTIGGPPANFISGSRIRHRPRSEYDGTAFCGWQTQPQGCGVQDHLERALSSFADAPAAVTAAAARTGRSRCRAGRISTALPSE
jgi:hypothetical protein